MTTSRLRDFAVYIAIGLCVGAACIWFAERNIDAKWLSLTLETCLVFGYVVGTLRRFGRQPVFWFGLAMVFIIHVVAFALILRHVSQWRAPSVGLIGAIETWFVVTAGGAVVERTLATPKQTPMDRASRNR